MSCCCDGNQPKHYVLLSADIRFVPADASSRINVGLGALASLRNQAVVRAVPFVNNAGFSPVSFGAVQMAPTHSLSAPVRPSSIPPLVVGVGIALVLAGGVAVFILATRKARR